MVDVASRKRIHVLDSRETRQWHSPFNAHLRECRQIRIIDRYRQLACRAGFAEFAIYDAFEMLVARGVATE